MIALAGSIEIVVAPLELLLLEVEERGAQMCNPGGLVLSCVAYAHLRSRFLVEIAITEGTLDWSVSRDVSDRSNT